MRDACTGGSSERILVCGYKDAEGTASPEEASVDTRPDREDNAISRWCPVPRPNRLMLRIPDLFTIFYPFGLTCHHFFSKKYQKIIDLGEGGESKRSAAGSN
jgi:hypothetical protein